MLALFHRLLPTTSVALVAVFAVAAAAFMSAAPAVAATTGSGTVSTDVRQPSDFQAIAARGSFDVTVRPGPATRVEVRADDNLLPLVETAVEGDTLHLRWQRGSAPRPRTPVTVLVIAPRLAAFANAGSGDARIEGFDTPALKVSLAGSGDLRLERLQAGELTVAISGSADVRGDGRAGKLSISIAGSGDVRLGDLRADDVAVRIAGSGNAEVHAEKKLEVTVAGSGDVVYRGDPAVKSRIAGSGEVRKR